jgi:hypothetical protein
MLVGALAVQMASALQASCFCGAVKLRVLDAAAPPLASSICHCRTCRSLTGAPFLANIMLPADRLEVRDRDGGEAKLLELHTSKHVTRKRCAACYSPVLAVMEGRKRVVVPASLFDPPHPVSWSAQHHLYYDRRVIDVDDTLPKFRTHMGSASWDGELADAGTSSDTSDRS